MTKQRVRGLDTLRFVAAAWVVLFHLRIVDPQTTNASFPVMLVKRFEVLSLCGTAAVMAFFVISGLCIHYPYRNGKSTPRLIPFLARRYTRIFIPLLAAMVLDFSIRPEDNGFRRGVVWSLYAEVVYYTLYPIVLLPLGRRFGWKPLLFAAAVAAGTLITLTNQGGGDYQAFGDFGQGFGPYIHILAIARNSIVGLLPWLLGCALAERLERPGTAPSRRILWSWRLAIWFGGVVMLALRFHSPLGFPIGFPWTGDAFAVLVYLWLEREIRFYEVHEPPAVLERAGAASYSIYVTHCQVSKITIWALGLPSGIQPVPVHLLVLGCVGLFSTVFYFLVERPSHRLAQRLFAGSTRRGSPSPQVGGEVASTALTSS